MVKKKSNNHENLKEKNPKKRIKKIAKVTVDLV